VDDQVADQADAVGGVVRVAQQALALAYGGGVVL
jgi:hypothetical protein